MAQHHLTDDLLMRYAAGEVNSALGLLVASHLALCPECRTKTKLCEAIGGELLEEVQIEPPYTPAAMITAEAEFSKLWSKCLCTEQVKPAEKPASLCKILPPPLQRVFASGAKELAWEQRCGKLAEITLPAWPGDDRYTKAKLLKITAGSAMPAHTHDALEFTLVLAGTFADRGQTYQRGDVCVADHAVTHTPTAGLSEDCICLAVTTGPLRLTGFIGTLLNPFIRC